MSIRVLEVENKVVILDKKVEHSNGYVNTQRVWEVTIGYDQLNYWYTAYCPAINQRLHWRPSEVDEKDKYLDHILKSVEYYDSKF